MEKSIEIRSYQGTQPEIRANEKGEKSRTVVGYAAVFERWSHPMLWFKEKIDRNAFDGVLGDDVVAVFNHNDNLILARNKKTLYITVDDTGLRYEFEAPNTTAGNDLLESIARGDIEGSSFRFTIDGEAWEKAPKDDPDGVEEYRTITKIGRLIDVGPVTFPAYPDSTVAKRSMEGYYTKIKNREDNTTKISATARSRKLHLLKFK